MENKNKKKKPKEKKKRSQIVTLAILVAVLILMDAVIIYYLYNESKSTQEKSKSEVSRCSDQTPYSSCSTEKPYYCVNGELLKKAFTCGCPEGYEVNFQDCKKVWWLELQHTQSCPLLPVSTKPAINPTSTPNTKLTLSEKPINNQKTTPDKSPIIVGINIVGIFILIIGFQTF